MKCAANPTEFLFREFAREVKYDKDVNQSELVQFPVCGDKHHLYYKLIRQFADSCSSTSIKADRISQCTSGHPLVLINKDRRKSIVNLKEVFCYGCLQPLSFPVVSFYGCVVCKYFLHRLCSTKLPRMMEHPSHPTHTLVKCQKIGDFIKCNICSNQSNGIFYQCEKSSCSFFIDIMCASLPRQIKHESHKHFLTQQIDNPKVGNCNGCNSGPMSGGFFSCGICQFNLHVGCAISPGTVKHRWDEHQLRLTYPPVKQHPHDFDCEFCSKNINPNFWFYHCRECDLSLHRQCIKQGNLLPKFYQNNLRFPDEQCAIL
ncbi:hypothetical protein POM88_012690 [Heracleum sosnowskyi]|uniref:DC1 domain-containing protein n=1 Tax=Heracleum sosnowskyi TaxID=360622 RepID=A0AAD8N206_9APIA|nr:hypothetical protein POM88_012690 [Heracleum sosnowskyi]